MIPELPMRRRQGHLRHDPQSGRMVLDGWELHCGDTFEVREPYSPSRFPGPWKGTRIEMAGGDWVLMGISGDIDGLEARSYDE